MGSFQRMTNPATKPTRSKPTAKSTKSTTPKPAAKTATKTTAAKPAAKSTKSTTKSAAAKPVETSEITKTTKLSEADEQCIVDAYAALNAARSKFDDLVEHYLRNGVSPSHVGKPIGLGNSSIRRIAFRRNIEGIK